MYFLAFLAVPHIKVHGLTLSLVTLSRLFSYNVFVRQCFCPRGMLTMKELYTYSLEVRQTQENFTVHIFNCYLFFI